MRDEEEGWARVCVEELGGHLFARLLPSFKSFFYKKRKKEKPPLLKLEIGTGMAR